MSTSVMTRTPTEPPPESGAGTRTKLRRPSVGHIVITVVAIAAGILNYVVLTGGQPQVEVLVAARELPAGTVLSPGDVETVSVVLDGPVRTSFVPPGQDLTGQVLVTDLAAGVPVRLVDVREAAASDGLRRMSLPVDRELAVGGVIGRGDRVDVLLADAGAAHYLVVDAEVKAVAAASDSPLDGLGRYFVTVAVDGATARCLAAGLTTGELTVVLSTGAEATTADGCTDDGRLIPLVADSTYPVVRAPSGATPEGDRDTGEVGQ